MSAKTIDKNLPNKLTILRVLLVPFFLLAVWLPLFTPLSETASRVIAALLFAFCSATDFIDGRLARKYALVSDFGKFMDPLADKFLVIGALLACVLVFDGAMRFGLIASSIVIIFRELAVSSMRLVAKNADGVVIAAALPGKIKTFSECVFILLLLLEDPFLGSLLPFFMNRPLTWTCMLVMDFFTVYSGLDYFKTYKKYILG